MDNLPLSTQLMVSIFLPSPPTPLFPVGGPVGKVDLDVAGGVNLEYLAHVELAHVPGEIQCCLVAVGNVALVVVGNVVLVAIEQVPLGNDLVAVRNIVLVAVKQVLFAMSPGCTCWPPRYPGSADPLLGGCRNRSLGPTLKYRQLGNAIYSSN